MRHNFMKTQELPSFLINFIGGKKDPLMLEIPDMSEKADKTSINMLILIND